MPVFGSFNRPVGAAVDVRELEYISALLQTDLPHLRRDGTIKARDILIYLRSRYGLVVEIDQALDILLGLGGDCLDERLDEALLDVDKVELRDHEHRTRQQMMEMAQENDTAINPILESHIRRRYKSTARMEISDAEKNANEDQASPSKKKKTFGRSVAVDKESERLAKYAEDANLDLVQLLSIIVMPTLARAGKEWIMRNIDGTDPGEMPVDDSIESSCWTLTYWIEKHRLKNKRADIARIQSLRPNPSHIIEDVHQMLLSTIEDDEEDKVEMENLVAEDEESLPILNAKLVRRLLECYGEYERAADIELVDEMLRMAIGDRGGGAEPIFNEESFVRALTADMEEWDVGCEDNISTAINDIFGFESYKEYGELVRTRRNDTDHDTKDGEANAVRPSDVDIELGRSHSGGNESTGTGVNVELVASISASKEEMGESTADATAVKLIRKPTASHIDFVVDNPRYLSYTVFSWVFFVTTALCYMSLFQSLPIVRGGVCRGSDFGCTLAGTIWSWLMLALGLVVAGYVIMAPIALANNATIRSTRITLFSFVWTAICATIPYVMVYLWRQDIEPPYEDAESIASQWWFISFMRLTLVMGVLLSLLLFLQVPLNTAAAIKRRRDGKIHRWMIAQNIRSSAQIKMAATRKVNNLLANAHSLHPSVGSGPEIRSDIIMIGGKKLSKTERTMSNFVLFGEREVASGGLFWTWRKMFDRSLFDAEGVWLHSRLFVGQAAQLIISVFLIGFFFAGTPILAERSQKARDDLIAEFGDAGLPQWIYDIIPTEEQVRYALYPASSIATLVALLLMLLYIPSTVSTILKLRCGKIPSLHDGSFVKYRIASDSIYLNVGNMIYALVGGCILFFLLIAVVIFLCIWPTTQPFMQLLAAWLLGLVITILLKTISIKICRAHFFQAFYRTRPAAANWASLALECWYIGLGGGVLVARFTQFVLASLFWIGRIDAPYLSPDVNIGGFGFDLVPINYRKDLLTHDAHRHPFIERLGTMFLMRLTRGSGFSCRAGAAWRQIFVLALCPWLTKNRVFKSKVDSCLSERLDKAAADRGEKVLNNDDDAKAFGDRIIDTAWTKMRDGLKDGAVTIATEVVDTWPPKRKEKKNT